jgi:hypothetical protein
MTLLYDLVDLAHRHDLVRTVTAEPDGCDFYELRTADPISVRIRPDGRFSNAVADGEFVSLGQVMRLLLAEIGPESPQAETRPRRSASV